jgi:hypothetical protein
LHTTEFDPMCLQPAIPPGAIATARPQCRQIMQTLEFHIHSIKVLHAKSDVVRKTVG